MDYWRSISKQVKSEDDQEDNEGFLAKEFSKLTFVHPDSVLSCYLNATPVRSTISDDSNFIFPFRYNVSQKSALHQALKSTISIIEGPPGTGKTQTILNILANLTVMQGKTVAVVSGNNAAVANVREKLEREGYHFFVANLGKKENKEHFFRNLPEWDVSDWLSEQSEGGITEKLASLDSSIRRLMELDRERAVLKQKLSAYLLEQKHFEHFFAQKDVQQLRRLSFYRQTPERILEFMKDSFLAVEFGTKDNLFYKFKLFFKHGFTRFRLLKDQGHDVILNYQRQFYVFRVEELTKQIDAIERELRSQSYQQLMDEHQLYSIKLLRQKLHEKYHNRQKLKCDEKSYMNWKHFRSFIEHYPIVLSTTHSLRNSIPGNYLFDYCIIDESSQVDLLTGALALSCCKRAIIVGDTKQLPQIVDKEIEKRLGNDAYAEMNDAYNYFQHNVLSSLLALYGDSIPKVMLREHYRCHPRIIEFCNRKYYNGELITFTHETETDTPLLIYRTVEGNHMRDGRKGKFNQRELDVIEQEILRGLIEEAARHSDIGVVTPFRNQADKASKQFHSLVESDTIHKYQGREKPTMIMSTVLDQTRSGKIGMKFVNDPCKINVAVSRAQNQFILVTDRKAFKKYGNEISDLMRYMEYSTLDPNVVESEIVSIFDLLYQEYSDKLRRFREKVGQYNSSRHKSENIMHTLLDMILQESRYKDFQLANQVLLLNLFPNLTILDEGEQRFVRHRASVDFVIYHKFDNSPALAIEVDGFAFHENNPKQLERDKKKEKIFEKYGIALHRFPTTGSGEETKLRGLLDKQMSAKMDSL
ncbi:MULTISPECIES: AAA domain-containing protein [unclassified Paenibacillus]|uniref:AAA domain-containing protein n=1 Tax=unclassified Paenibacillus TaxID=185978 RepID=UPI001AE4338F|nr:MULTISPECIES: AAA domain-containing protein [unclassified Paenibacillus]MBP1157664.1 superfamily I DNA and/or RNA helicase [Paenibacillus sp. PvP091]MBP1171599.1 superfamily I DNA and/or RNA helicase [Paenibacillus sp. PvR098]MBP2437980.1 superfamily I DNA and/or RNA helicase [Paenibacillus sp. PvP052]